MAAARPLKERSKQSPEEQNVVGLCDPVWATTRPVAVTLRKMGSYQRVWQIIGFILNCSVLEGGGGKEQRPYSPLNPALA